MLESEIHLVIDQILSVMDTVTKNRPKSLEASYEKFEALLNKLAPAKFSEIQDRSLRSKVANIWVRAFAKHQGIRQRNIFMLGTLDVKVRIMLIKHGFYIDYATKSGKTILHQCFDILNHTLSAPILDALILQGTLSSILDKKFHSKKASTTCNIFEHIEGHLDRAIARGNTAGNIKFIQWKKFARDLIDQLAERNITHSFSENIESKLRIESTKKRASTIPTETPQPKTKVLRFSTISIAEVMRHEQLLTQRAPSILNAFEKIDPLPGKLSCQDVSNLVTDFFKSVKDALVDDLTQSSASRLTL